MSCDKAAVVLAHGSDTCKVGFAGDQEPKQIFPTAVGRPRPNIRENIRKDIELKDIYVGEEAIAKRGTFLTTKFPIEWGVITNFDDMEELWRYTFDTALQCSPEERPILLTEVPCNPKCNRERVTQIMFEKFEVPAMYLANQSVLSLYASGRTTGVVLDSGQTTTYSVAIYEGHSIPYATKHLPIGGDDVTDVFMKRISELGYAISNDRSLLREIRCMKEKLGYVAMDLEQELAKAASSEDLRRSYEMTSGAVYTIDSDRSKCPECIFTPSIFGLELPGIQVLPNQSIQRCDADIRNDLYSNIVLSGGNTKFPGMAERLQKEISTLVPDGVMPNVIPNALAHSEWVGGSILASLPEFQNAWITKDEYDEYGPNMVHLKCF